jgi:hypothetical protein
MLDLQNNSTELSYGMMWMSRVGAGDSPFRDLRNVTYQTSRQRMPVSVIL